MLSEKDLDDLLDEAIEDFGPEVTPKARTEESSRAEHLSGEDAQYIDDLTAQFERTFSALLESNPDLALNNVEPPSLDNSPRESPEAGVSHSINKTLEGLMADASTTPQPGSGTADNMLPMLEGLLGKLLSKEVLQEPLEELQSMYPAWLESNSEHQHIAQYKEQYSVVQKICSIFNQPQGQAQGSKVYELLCQMQDTGPPPPDIVSAMSQDMPQGLPGAGPQGVPGDAPGCPVQ